jgi:hypothetical protein
MSNYHALQTSLKKRFSHGVTFNAHYTFGKAIEQGGIDNMTASGTSTIQDHRNIRASRGRHVADIRHNFTLDHSWDIPLDRWFGANSGFTRQLTRGWQIFGILAIRSGMPINIQSGRDNYGLGTTTGQRPDFVGGPVYLDGYESSSTHQYLSRAAFADPCDGRGLRRPCGMFGNLGAYTLGGPGSTFYDLSIFKNFAITERTSLQIRSEFFNIFNHANFNNPNTTLTSSTFGQITSAQRAREMQFAAKFIW